MSLTFPTRLGASREPGRYRGEPTRASHCHCLPAPVMLASSDTCLRCGKYSKDTIADTWAQRAIAAAKPARKRASQKT